MASRKAFTKGRQGHYIRNGKDAEEWAKCRKNPYYFISKYVRITHPDKGDIPFSLYGFQASIILEWLKYQATCMLKPRQMGISTLVAAYLLWLFLFHSHKHCYLVSIKQATARGTMRRIKHMYNNLPSFLKVEVINGTPGSVGTADSMIGANGSIIEVTGATPDAGRSGSYSVLVLDEAAFQQRADTVFGAAGPATLNNGGQVIILSTAFGMGNFFHRTYTGAWSGENGFHPIRLKWQMHPDYTQEWHDMQLKRLGRLRTAQEIDCNFLQSGFNVFDMGRIKAIESRLMDQNPVSTFAGDMGLIYFDPVPGVEYFIGGDVATGRGRDYSAFSVYDHNGKEHACFKGKMGVREYGLLMMKIGNKFNRAVLAPEINAIGEGVIATFQEHGYSNVYTTVSQVLRMDEFQKDESMVHGWLTTGKTRHEIITGMDDDLRDDLVELWNPHFVNESQTFIYNSMNRAVAMGKHSGADGKADAMYEEEGSGTVYTDDSILGACIGNAVRKNPARFKGALPFR